MKNWYKFPDISHIKRYPPKGNALVVLHFLCQKMQIIPTFLVVQSVKVYVGPNEYAISTRVLSQKVGITHNSTRKAIVCLIKHNLIEKEQIHSGKKKLITKFKVVFAEKEHTKNQQFTHEIDFSPKKGTHQPQKGTHKGVKKEHTKFGYLTKNSSTKKGLNGDAIHRDQDNKNIEYPKHENNKKGIHDTHIKKGLSTASYNPEISSVVNRLLTKKEHTNTQKGTHHSNKKLFNIEEISSRYMMERSGGG